MEGPACPCLRYIGCLDEKPVMGSLQEVMASQDLWGLVRARGGACLAPHIGGALHEEGLRQPALEALCQHHGDSGSSRNRTLDSCPPFATPAVRAEKRVAGYSTWGHGVPCRSCKNARATLADSCSEGSSFLAVSCHCVHDMICLKSVAAGQQSTHPGWHVHCCPRRVHCILSS